MHAQQAQTQVRDRTRVSVHMYISPVTKKPKIKLPSKMRPPLKPETKRPKNKTPDLFLGAGVYANMTCHFDPFNYSYSITLQSRMQAPTRYSSNRKLGACIWGGACIWEKNKKWSRSWQATR